MDDLASPQLDEKAIQDRLRLLEQRIRRIEARLELIPLPDGAGPGSPDNRQTAALESDGIPEHSLEQGIGEFGLGWIGTVVLFLGIVFLMTYAFAGGHRILGCVMGYAAAAGLYLAASHWQKAVPHLSRTTVASSLLLLYYVTARLHFFDDVPVVASERVSLIVLSAVVAGIFALGILRGSQALSGLALLLGLYTALLSDSPSATFAVAALASATAAFLAIRAGWRGLFLTAVPLVYAAHLLWLAGNPLSVNAIPAVHEYSLVWLILCAVMFSVPALLVASERALDGVWISAILVNTAGFSLAVSAVCFVHFPNRYPPIYLGLAAGCLVLSTVHWVRRHEELVASIYACFGFLALSIAIYGYAGVPTAFLWLSLQSLLVVSMALWFRSRVLVVSNSLIYFCILVLYLTISGLSDWVNFSFALVALASARVMNWKKERLTLRTDMLRNIYLVLAFGLVLFSIYRAVPSQYLSLTWTAAAVGYFVLSVILKNIKYRWMSMFTMLITIVYLFMVDLARLSSITRVAAFLFLGLIALLISVFYTKYRHLLTKSQAGGRQ